MAKTIVPSVAYIKEYLQYLPKSALIHWLKRKGKIASAPPADGFYSKLNKLISKEKLAWSDLEAAVFDIEENGGKHIFLKVADGGFPKTKAAFNTFLTNSDIPLIQRQRRSFRASTKPTINHIIWETVNGINYIVVKFSELQEEVKLNTETGKVTFEPQPVFVVFRIDVGSGFTEARFDTPLQKHIHKDAEHKSSTAVYHQYYFDRLNALFPGIHIEQFGMAQICKYIIKERKFFRWSQDLNTVTGNGKQKYSVASGDVRDLPARKAAEAEDGHNWLTDDIVGYWMSAPSGGVLWKDLFMRLSNRDSAIKFQKDCLAIELDYAVEKIRSFQESL